LHLGSLLTPSERRLAALLFLLTLLGSVARIGRTLSPEVETWLASEPQESTPTGADSVRGEEKRERESMPVQERDESWSIDPNHADRESLIRLPGVGPVLADRILEDRTQNGPFRSPEDLCRVKGIGARTLERLRPHIRFQ